MLQVERVDLRHTSLLARKQVLRSIVPRAGNMTFSEHIADARRQTFKTAQTLGIEGVVRRRAASTYRSGRGTDPGMDVLSGTPDLERCLAHLAELLKVLSSTRSLRTGAAHNFHRYTV